MSKRVIVSAILLILLAAPVVLAGGAQEQPKTAPAATAPAAAPAKEAPMLAEMVKAGKLPPLAQRLPEKPFLVQAKQVGKYGGTLRRVYTGLGDTPGFTKLSQAWLITATPDGGKLVPDLAERWEESADGRNYTFFLRKGVKWSDGQPWTAADIVFWYEHIVMNKELNPGVPTIMRVGDDPIKVVKVDDHTVRFELPAASAVFLQNMAQDNNGTGHAGAPAHYLKQFHPAFVSKDDLDKKVKEAQFDKWTQLFEQKATFTGNPVLEKGEYFVLAA